MKIHHTCAVIVTVLCHVTVSFAKIAKINPKMIMGYDSGELKRCNFNNPKKCKTLSEQESPVSSLAVAGEFVYIGLQSGELRRCSLFRSSNCTIFHQLNSGINAIAISRKDLYVGTSEGITKCGLRKSESCELFYESETPVYSLLAFGGNLYAGTDNFVLRCLQNDSLDCTVLTNTTSTVKAVTAFGKRLYLGSKEGSVHICELNNDTDCYTLFETQSEVTDIDIFERILQTSLKSGEIVRFNFDTEEKSTILEGNISSPVLSMSVIYDTTPVRNHYIGESNSCVWQFMACPPFVVYYDVQSRAALELHVKDNKIYTAEGDLFDTDESDFSHSGSRAIFVMDSSGRIFASNQHPIGLLHHSSLMSGKPAAAAGELKVNQGELMSISSCSGHYRPSIALTKQVLSSLQRQGYDNKNVTIIDCFRRSELLIDLNYKKTDLYYEALYEKYSHKINKINKRT